MFIGVLVTTPWCTRLNNAHCLGKQLRYSSTVPALPHTLALVFQDSSPPPSRTLTTPIIQIVLIAMVVCPLTLIVIRVVLRLGHPSESYTPEVRKTPLHITEEDCTEPIHVGLHSLEGV